MADLTSIVIAAYNSANRLICAVESIRQQTVTDLEIIVIGDCVTDDSAERLAVLDDDRIRWENLPTNWGEQSVPSNRGLELAQGEHVLFLNQDDLLLPDHVERCLATIATHGVDVAWSPYLVIPPGARPGEPHPEEPITLLGITSRHPAFDPIEFIPASCTAWRRSALVELGGWRTAAEVTVSPSQDLLFRAWRSGLRMRCTGHPTVLVLWSGERRTAYTPGDPATDHLRWWQAMRDDPGVIDRTLAELVVPTTAQARNGRQAASRVGRSLAKRALTAVLAPWSIHPMTPMYLRRFRGTGGFINTVRAKSGLDARSYRGGRTR